MTIRANTIVARSDSDWDGTKYRVESVRGITAIVRNLANYQRTDMDINQLVVRYQVDPFERGDVVRVREEYQDRYNEVDGLNDLTVILQSTSSNAPLCTVENNNGDTFNILNERLELYRPAKALKQGDKVVIDLDLAAKYSGDGDLSAWDKSGKVLELTEDSGSRYVQTTSHVREADNKWISNNVPTRWLKLVEDTPKRVVGETIEFEDILVGDTVKATDTVSGLLREFTGVVKECYTHYDNSILRAVGGGVFPLKSDGVVFTLLKEAPEPVDENLQRLLDAEVGDLAYGTYANEYWIKVGDDEWQMTIGGQIRTTNDVFGSLYKLKYGTLEIYRKVESDN